MKPNRPKKANAIAPLAAEKRGLRNSRMSSSGSRRRSSQTTKPASATAAATNPPIVRAEAQPLDGASIVVQTNNPMPAIEPNAPIGSNRPGWALRLSGTTRRPASRAMTATGTLTHNTAPHEKCSSSRPPVTGPSATPRPVTPDQMPMAPARSCASVKVELSRARVAG